VQFLRVDVDKHQAIAAKYKITAMPTFIAIVDGEVKDTVCAFRACLLRHALSSNELFSYKALILMV
jgi:thioredoxin-like negative regulator of GroEL